MISMGRVVLVSSALVAVLLVGPAGAEIRDCRVHVDRLPPEVRGGQAYRLTYDIPASLNIVWRFKTQFSNSFLERNRYISHHRLVSLADNVAITENRYSVLPEALFRWETRIYPERRRLEFKLINKGRAGAHGHRFHYGNIQLEEQGRFTRIIQVAYFDFWGSGFWAVYPWRGGMQSFLEYTAKWECKEAVRFQQSIGPASKENTVRPN